MVVPINAVEKLLVHSDSGSGDLSPHITQRSLVRVLRGPHQRCQGVVTQKLNQGRELMIMDPDNKETVSGINSSESKCLLRWPSSLLQTTRSSPSTFFRIPHEPRRICLDHGYTWQSSQLLETSLKYTRVMVMAWRDVFKRLAMM